MFQKKKNLRLIRTLPEKERSTPELDVRSVCGGVLVQDKDFAESGRTKLAASHAAPCCNSRPHQVVDLEVGCRQQPVPLPAPKLRQRSLQGSALLDIECGLLGRKKAGEAVQNVLEFLWQHHRAVKNDDRYKIDVRIVKPRQHRQKKLRDLRDQYKEQQ